MKKIKSDIGSSKLKSPDETYEIVYVRPEDESIYLSNRNQVQLNARMARWFHDYDLNQTIWSDGVYEILEINPEKTNANYFSFLEVIHPEDRHIKIKSSDELLSSRKPIDISYRLLFSNSRIKWINEICSTDFKENGAPIRSFGTIQDITKYKVKEENFRLKEERINTLIDLYPSPIAICQNNRIIIVNQAARKLFESKEPTGIIGKQISEIIHPDYRNLFSQKIRFLNQGNHEHPFECKIINNRNQYLDAEVTLIPNVFEGKAIIQLVLNNITKQKKAENDLASANERFSSMAQSLSAFLWKVNLDGIITEISPKTAKLFGYNYNEIINHNISRFLTEDSYSAFFPQIIKSKSGSETKFNQIRHIFELFVKSGSKRWIEVLSTPVFDSKEKLTGFSGLCLDITERIKTENQLKQNQKKLNDLIATKDRFFAVIAHDLRAPFNSILGFLDILENQYDDFSDTDKKKYIRLIEENAVSTLALLESLLEWAKTQKGQHLYKPEKFRIESLINHVLDNLSSALSLKNLKVKVSVPENMDIIADFRMLSTIFLNLISNAIKYSHLGGSIELSAMNDTEKIIFSVSDFGVGIPEDIQKKLFRINEDITTLGTAKEKGSGFGLILCEEFVEIHHGKIWVESEYGKGSKFIFTIPIK